MSDLRTRIAAALLQRFFARADVALDAADAVIAELALTEERADKQRSLHVCATPGLHYRYVTDWKADDE